MQSVPKQRKMEISGNSFDFDDMFSESSDQKEEMRAGTGSMDAGQTGELYSA